MGGCKKIMKKTPANTGASLVLQSYYRLGAVIVAMRVSSSHSTV